MQRVPSLYIAMSEKGGRGVFTAGPLSKGDLIEICPVIILPGDQMKSIHTTVLHDYYFIWGTALNEAAIALGYGSLYNHSETPNAEVHLDYENDSMEIHCIREVPGGDEILIHYRDHPDFDNVLWFESQ